MMTDVKYYDNKQPRQFYLDTLVEFYGKMGSKKFWADSKQQQIALEAFMQDYFRVDHGEYADEDAISFQAAMDEFGIRERYMVRLDSTGE